MKNLRVAYLLVQFPQLSQTFISREIVALQELGVGVSIFSLFNPPSDLGVAHKINEELQSLAHYSSFFSIDVISSQFFFLKKSPKKYLKAFFKVIQYSYKKPKLLAQALLCFPKTVYFSRLMMEDEVEHIHCHFVTLGSILGKAASILVGTTLSLHPHAAGLFTRDQNTVIRQLSEATKIVTISTYHRDYIAQICPSISTEDIEIVYCSIDTDLFSPATASPQKDEIQIFSVGRLIEKKGFTYLIDACYLLRKKDVNFKCHIVGSGPQFKMLQSKIEALDLGDYVILHGAKPQSEILDYYHASDIFTLPCVVAADGNKDGLPVVLIEAMSCGLPVVTTPVAGIIDLVSDRQNGLLVLERDSQKLASHFVC